MEEYDDNGIVLSDHRSVLNRWACDYKELGLTLLSPTNPTLMLTAK